MSLSQYVFKVVLSLRKIVDVKQENAKIYTFYLTFTDIVQIFWILFVPLAISLF